MALEGTKYENFKNAPLPAFNELDSDKLVYTSESIHLHPSHFLQIYGAMIEKKYSIPTGWDGYGLIDLKRMVKEYYLIIDSESVEDPITFEKTIICSLNEY